MKQLNRKAMSLLLSICMLLSLLPALTLGASAVSVDVTVGTESTASDTAYTGTGWSWTPGSGSAAGTLTLSGVNLTSETGGIQLLCAANLVLEGTNQVAGSVVDAAYSTKAAIYVQGNLTVSGSGTLAVAADCEYGIDAYTLTFNSGYIVVSNTYTSNSVAINSRSISGVTVNGGYISASTTASGSSCLHGSPITINGGYVQASSSSTVDCRVVWAQNGSITVSGGYLETNSGTYGILANTNITNSGGVIKSTGGSTYGIMATNSLNYTGGVTIASSPHRAIWGTISGANNEQLFDNTGNTVATTGSALASSELKSVVIAKETANKFTSATTLDGTYVYGGLWQPSAAATVSGGSYVYSSASNGCEANYDMNINATLVIAGTMRGIFAEAAIAINIASTGTLITPCDRGLYTSSDVCPNITNAGNIVSIAPTDYGLTTSGSLTQNGGNIIAIENAANTGTAIHMETITVNDGCITVYAPAGRGIDCYNLTQTGGAVTAYSGKSATCGITYNDSTTVQATPGAITVPNGEAVFGSESLYGSLKKAYRTAANFTSTIYASVAPYKEARASVVFLSKTAPDPTISIAADNDTALTKDDTKTTKTYTVTASNFGRVTTDAFTINWYSDATGGTPLATAPTGVYVDKTSVTTLTAHIDRTAQAGNYYFSLTDADTYYTPNESATSNIITLNVGKKLFTPAAISASVPTEGKTGNTVTLTKSTTGGTYGTPVIGGTTPGLISGTPTITGDTLTFDTTAKSDGTSATITIPVTGCTDYQDYQIVVTVTASTFGAAVSGTVNGYTGVALSSQTVTVTLTGDKFVTTLPTTTGWVTNLPTGISAIATRTSDTMATITFNGSTGVASTSPIAVTIPANSMVAHTDACPASSSAAYAITASTYTMTLTPGTPSTFTALDYGYNTGSNVTYTIKNTGNQTLTGLGAAVTVGSSNFSVETPAATLAPNATTTVTVTSKTGLNAGTHAGTLTVSANNAASQTAALSQTVNKTVYSGTTINKDITTYSGSANTGTITLADLFGTDIPAGAAFTAVTPSGTPTVMDTVAVNDTDKTKLDYTSLRAASVGSSDTYTATITSTNYRDITATIKFTAQNPIVTFDARGGKWADEATTKTATIIGGTVEKPADPSFNGYTFAGWYTGLDGTGTLVTGTDTITKSTTLYAKWTKGDKTIRTSKLDFTDSATPPAWQTGCTAPTGKSTLWTNAEGWSYDTATKTLTLSGLYLDTTDCNAIILPDGATVTLDANTESTVKSSYSGSSFTAALLGYESGATGKAGITIKGSGTLNAYAGVSSGDDSVAICGTYGVTIEDTPTVNAYGGGNATTPTGTNSVGISSPNRNVLIKSGNVTATGGASNATADVKTSAGISAGGTLTIEGGNVTATGGTATNKANSCGLFSAGGTTISGGTVKAEGGTVGNNTISAGIASAGNISFTGGTTAAKGNRTAVATIDSTKDINITGVSITDPSGAAVGTLNGYKMILSNSAPVTSVTIGKESATPSYSGGSSPAKITVPASSNAGSASVSASVSGSTATVAPTAAQIATVASGTKNTGTVKIDVSGVKAVNMAVIPAKLVSAAQAAENSTGLTVVLPTGSVTLDKAALDSAGSNDVKIQVDSVDPAKLTAAQRATLGDQAENVTIVDVNVYVNNVLTHNFNGGKITVSVPYTLKSGENSNAITVWYLADDGTITPMNGKYNAATKMVEFTTVHLSDYLIASFPFTDVAESAWYYGDVVYTYTHGLFAGTTDTTFAPGTAINRGMIVTVLWRMAGKPAPKASTSFPDVMSGSYCADAVAWAVENGVVLGYSNGKYGPDDAITRQQLAAILFRYAKFKGYDVSVGEDTNILSYHDAFSISEYAIPALQWACGAGLIQGNGNNLMPRNGATRAQVAAMLTRFCQNVVKK